MGKTVSIVINMDDGGTQSLELVDATIAISDESGDVTERFKSRVGWQVLEKTYRRTLIIDGLVVGADKQEAEEGGT